jgi:hypothetical protein
MFERCFGKAKGAAEHHLAPEPRDDLPGCNDQQQQSRAAQTSLPANIHVNMPPQQ